MTIYKYAGFWQRLVAYTIDNVIIYIILFLLAVIITTAFILGSMSGGAGKWIANLTDPAYLTSLVLLSVLFYVAVSTAYFTYFHGIKGRTPGKMLLNLQVLASDGTPIGFGTAFLRSVGYLVSSLLFTIPLGFIWAAFDKKKQAWHDKIAGTVVIIRADNDHADGLNIPQSPPAVSTVQQTEEKSGDDAQKSFIPLNEASPDENKDNMNRS